MIRACLLLALLAALMAGCDKAPGGATAGSSSQITTTATDQLDRTKALEVSKTTVATVQAPAASLIFEALTQPLPAPKIDRQIAAKGVAALPGTTDAERVLSVLALASRSLPAWPVNPLDNQAGAKRWAGAVAAAIELADQVAPPMAAALAGRVLADQAEASALIRAQYAQLDHAALWSRYLQRAKALQGGVTLDLADASGVRFLTPGGVVFIDGGGVTLTSSGTLTYAPAKGTLASKSYTVAMSSGTGATMARTRTQGGSEGTSEALTADAVAGLK